MKRYPNSRTAFPIAPRTPMRAALRRIKKKAFLALVQNLVPVTTDGRE